MHLYPPGTSLHWCHLQLFRQMSDGVLLAVDLHTADDCTPQLFLSKVTVKMHKFLLGGVNSPWTEWEKVILMLPYLRLADDVNPHCCAKTLLRGACVPPQDMSVVPPEPRLEMNLLLCDCWSWRSRWGWDGTLYFWNTPPAVFTYGPYWCWSPNRGHLHTWQHGGSERCSSVLGQSREKQRHPWWASICDGSPTGDTPSLTLHCWKHNKVVFKRNLDCYDWLWKVYFCSQS